VATRRGEEEPQNVPQPSELQTKESRIAAPEAAPPGTPAAFPFATLSEVNERCIELLVNAARSEERPSFALIAPLRELLTPMGPVQRRRASEIGFLLVDMEFHDPDWWAAICRYPDRQWRTGTWRGQFTRRSAIPLARDTLMLAWHSVQADPDTACVLLGLARPVADLIARLKLSDINRIALRRARHLYPRWYDQPLVWRTLLGAATAGARSLAMRNFQIQALQLIGGLLADGDSSPEKGSSR